MGGFWATNPKFVGFWAALLHRPFPGGWEEGQRALSGTSLGAKCFQAFAILFLPPGMTVTRSDLCPTLNFKPIPPPPSPPTGPQFRSPSHRAPRAKIFILRPLNPILPFSSPQL